MLSSDEIPAPILELIKIMAEITVDELITDGEECTDRRQRTQKKETST